MTFGCRSPPDSLFQRSEREVGQPVEQTAGLESMVSLGFGSRSRDHRLHEGNPARDEVNRLREGAASPADDIEHPFKRLKRQAMHQSDQVIDVNKLPLLHPISPQDNLATGDCGFDKTA